MKLRDLRSIVLALAVSIIAGPVYAQSFGSDDGLKFVPAVQNLAYASGQAMGGLQTITNFFRPNGVPSGINTNFQLSSIGGSTTAMTVYTYDALPTGSCPDRGSFVETAADVGNRFMAPFVLTPAVVGAGATSTTAQLTQVVSGRNHDSPAKTNLYICIVAGGAVTPATTSDLIGKISPSQD